MKKILTYITAAVLILVGLSLPIISRGQASTTQVRGLAPATSNASHNALIDPATIQGVPKQIIIPKINLDIAVAPGYYDPKSKTWDVSQTTAHYATITPPANTKSGNTFIYGHNLDSVFGRLPQLALGDSMLLKTNTGHTLSYRLTSVRETNPFDDRLFYYSGPAMVTLQTCSGLFDQNRTHYSLALTGIVE